MSTRNRVLSLVGFLTVLSLAIIFRSRNVQIGVGNYNDDAPSEIMGIELGNDYSRVGIIANDKLDLFKDREGHNAIPSFVAFTDQGPLVGREAKEQASDNPSNTIYNIRSLMGRNFSDPDFQAEIRELPYEVVEKHGHPAVKVQVNGLVNLISPEEISSMILKRLKTMAEDSRGRQLSDAVITVPAYFEDFQRQATKDAAALAGLDVSRLLNEPIAAGIAHRIDEPYYGYGEENLALIINVGDRRFDTTLLEVDSGVFEILASASGAYLGSDDFNDSLLNHVVKQYSNITKDPKAMERLRWEVRKVQESLLTASSAEIPTHLNVPVAITEHDIQRLRDESLNRILDSAQRVLQEAKIGEPDLDMIILTGSPSHVSNIKALLPSRFPSTQILDNKLVPPEIAVVHGAALQAHFISLEEEPCIIPFSWFNRLALGVETPDGVSHRLIPAFTFAPTRKSMIFKMEGEAQDMVELRIIEGESAVVEENSLLGVLVLGTANMGEGETEINVVMDMDAYYNELTVSMGEREREVTMIMKNVLERY